MRDKGTYKGAQHIVTVLQEEPAGTVVILTMSHYTGVEVTVAMAWYSCVFCDLSEHWSDHIFSILSNKLAQFRLCPLLLKETLYSQHQDCWLPCYTSGTQSATLGASPRNLHTRATKTDVCGCTAARHGPFAWVSCHTGLRQTPESLLWQPTMWINVIPEVRKYQWYSRCGITAHVESAISQVRHIHNDREVYRMENDQSDHE